jgi:hypothetical protein
MRLSASPHFANEAARIYRHDQKLGRNLITEESMA